MEEARRLQCGRIPAFGEWNYHHDDGDDDWSVMTQRFDSAMRVPLPVHEPIKRAKARPRRIPAFGKWNNHGDVDGSWPTAHKPLNQIRRDWDSVVSMGKQRKVKVRQSRVAADSGAHAGRKHCSFTVVKAVDDDLYEVPLEMLFRKPTGKGSTWWLRSLLMRCFGLNCVCIA